MQPQASEGRGSAAAAPARLPLRCSNFRTAEGNTRPSGGLIACAHPVCSPATLHHPQTPTRQLLPQGSCCSCCSTRSPQSCWRCPLLTTAVSPLAPHVTTHMQGLQLLLNTLAPIVLALRGEAPLLTRTEDLHEVRY